MTEKEVKDLLASKERFCLDVKNFVKYNPDNTKDWIKLHHDWLQDPSLVELPPTCRLLFLALCTLRGTKGEPLTNLTVTSIQLLTNLRGTCVEPLLVSLWKHKLIFVDKIREDKKRVSKRRREDISAEAKNASPETPRVHPKLADTKAAELVTRANLHPVTQDRYFAVYDDERFLHDEFIKMLDWLDANKQKSPKSSAGWTRFVNGWLSRGWERHRKHLPSQPRAAPKIDHDALWETGEKAS